MKIQTFNDTNGLFPSRLFRMIAAAVFAIAFPLITLVIHGNPSGMPPATPFPVAGAAVLTMVGGFMLLWCVYFCITSLKGKTAFLSLYVISFSIFAGLFIWLGLRVHRDYFTHIFQHILIYWLLFVLRNDLFVSLHSKKQYYTFLFIFNTVIFAASLLWIIFMGYAIVTRQEPRWAESIVYNAYNTILIFFLGITSFRLQLQRFRTIRIIGNDLFIDEWNFSNYFSDLDKRIVLEFLTNDGQKTCFMLENTLREGAAEKNGKNEKWNCRECLEEEHTTTKCPKYKNIYNRVLNIKKLFETLEIGTIITPENKMQIKQEGWKLRLFDDVRLVHQPKKTP